MVPLLGAALLVALHAVAGRRFADAVATGVAAAVLVMCLVLLKDAADGRVIYWFGNWTPRGSIVLGVAWVIDPIGAGMAAICAALVTAAFVFTWRYFDAVGVLFHSLMLVFLAAMCGFCLSGDLFNMFVYFELMSVAAYGLTGYKAEDPGPLQGALNFAITNSIGALMILSGIALLYARTGALNLAAIGRALSTSNLDGLVVMAFVFVVFGFLVKGAIVPFHFWLADAHAVAPTPVCVLFSGVMVELGLFAAARVYWTIFAPLFAVHVHDVRGLLVGIGTITALVGASMALMQTHLKRLLAFSTVTYAGLFLIGFAMLDARALAGTALFVLSHAFLKGALFMCAGVLLHRWGSVRIHALHGRGRTEPVVGVLFVVAAIALLGVPPFGTFYGKEMIEESASAAGYGWVVTVFVIAAGLSGAAGLGAAAAIFLGAGDAEGTDAAEDEVHFETAEHRARAPAVMIGPIVVLVVVGALLTAWPALVQATERAAVRFLDSSGYAAQVIDATAPLRAPAAQSVGISLGAVVAVLATAAVAVGGAVVTIQRRHLPARAVDIGSVLARFALRPLRAVHSGHAGDYVAWLTVGMAAFGGILAVLTR